MKSRILLLCCLLALVGAIGLKVSGNVQEKKAGRVTELLNEKLNLEKKFYWAMVQNDMGSGLVNRETRHRWSTLWLQSELELAKTQKERIAAIEHHLRRMEELHALNKKKAIPVSGIPKVTWVTEYYLLEAKLMLAKEKGQ